MKEQIPIHDFTRDDKSSIPFKIQELGFLTQYDTSEPHRHNYYEIFLFEKGSGFHMIDFEQIPVKTPSIHFVSPGQIHLVRRDLKSNGMIVLFSRDFYHTGLSEKDVLFDLPFLNNKDPYPVFNLDKKQFAELKILFDSLMQEHHSDNSHKEDILRSYLNILLLKCKTLHIAKPKNVVVENHTLQAVNHFKTLIEKNFTKLHLVNEYADLLNLSPNYLNEISKKVTGLNASDLIQERVMLEAKRLLMHSELNNKEVAFFLSFSDPSYFSRFFRKQTGYSPNEFRDKMRQKFL